MARDDRRRRRRGGRRLQSVRARFLLHGDGSRRRGARWTPFLGLRSSLVARARSHGDGGARLSTGSEEGGHGVRWGRGNGTGGVQKPPCARMTPRGAAAWLLLVDGAGGMLHAFHRAACGRG